MSFQYREAARVLTQVQKKRSSLKTLVFGGTASGDDGGAARRRTFALVSETLRHMPLLQKLSQRTSLMAGDAVRDESQAWVMLFDLLFGKGSIQGGGALKRHLVSHLPQLQAALAALKRQAGLPPDAPPDALLPNGARRYTFPRYARVNLLGATVEEAEQELRAGGLAPRRDDTVPSLLVLPHGTDLSAHPLVAKGHLVLQDKSSCFSAEVLLGAEGGAGPRERWLCGGDVVDACAAPGNKTLHLAALLSASSGAGGSAGEAGHGSSRGSGSSGRKRSASGGGAGNDASGHRGGKVFAFDRDPKRLALLQRRCDAAGAGGCVQARLADFLSVDADEPRYSRVRGILVDPSCSGSGIVTAPDRWQDSSGEKAATAAADGEQEGGGGSGGSGGGARVEKLARFQQAALLRALAFPHARRVVYSTCSVHARENEEVVAAALAQQAPPPPCRHAAGDGGGEQQQEQLGAWRLLRCLPAWQRRGVAPASGGLTAEQADCLVRAAPEDGTNGFFVALFGRDPVGEEGERDRGTTRCAGTEVDERQRTKKRLKSKRKKHNQKKRRQAAAAAAEAVGGVDGSGTALQESSDDSSGSDAEA